MFVYSYSYGGDRQIDHPGRKLVDVSHNPVHIIHKGTGDFYVFAGEYMLGTKATMQEAQGIIDRIFEAIVAGKSYLDLQAGE